ncbi:hypothetical protein RWX45_02710, partial [Actinomyces sp. MRS3W]|nr:hypothetical protein [Actinomyces sp. MRS3W]
PRSQPGADSLDAATAPLPPLPAATGATTSAPPPLPAPMNAASRRRWRLVGGVVVACLILAVIGAITVHVLNSRRGPEGVVESYLNLVAEGRAGEATAMVDPGVPNDQRLLLTDEVLVAATSRIEVVDVAAPSDSDSSSGASGRESVTVTATLSLDGERFELPLTVTPGDKEFGVLNTWEVTTPLIQPVTLSSNSLNALTVGGAEVTLDESEYGENGTLQYVYLGIYDIGVATNVSDYLEADTASLAVKPSMSGSGGQYLEVEGEPTETLEDLVLEAVNAQATNCVTPPGNLEDVCPYPLQATNLNSLSVTSAATEVTVEGQVFTSGPITFTTRDEPSEWNEDPDDEDWEYLFSGTIEWSDEGGEPTITVTDSSTYYGF